MKRHLVVIFGLAACLLAYGGVYFASTGQVRELRNRATPELAWLKQEFNLSEPEFKRISELHDAYLPQCRAMCEKIDAKNTEIRLLLESSTNVTADIQNALGDAARLRAQCQSQMLNHFYEVSRTMSPEQGKRYLNWVRSKTLNGSGGMEHVTTDKQVDSHGAMR